MSYRPVPVPSTGATTAVQLHPGDNVSVDTCDGRTLEFKLTAVEADALVGADVSVRFEEIAALRVERFDAAQTVLATVLAPVAIAGSLIVGSGQGGGLPEP